jgi:uncharacterized membrane protein (DUF441 family)
MANDNSVINVGFINQNNSVSISKELALEVKIENINGNTVPLFPTKNGYEYFVFRTRR